MADRIALVELDVGGNMLTVVGIDDACRAGSIPAEDNGVLVLYGLESHLNPEIRRYAGQQAMSIRLIEHVVLGCVRGLCFPFRVVRDLAVRSSGVGIEDAATAVVDICFGRRHPVSGHVRLTVWSTDDRSCRRCWSSTATTTAATAPAAATTRGTGLLSRSAAALGGCLADQDLGEHEDRRETQHDG